MIFKILGCGTSTGVPIPGCKCAVCTSSDPKNQRNRTSALIQVSPTTNILIDTSTDLRHQALKWKVESINAVLYTHAHADHILGLDDLRGYNFVQKKSIPCYATQPTLSQIRKLFSYVFDPVPGYSGGLVPQLTLHQIEDYKPFELFDVEITPFTLIHGNAPVSGFRIGEIAYATDCKEIPSASLNVIKGVRYLILDGLRYESHSTHLSIPEAVTLAQAIGAERTYLTHMTHSIDYAETNAKLPLGIELAYDGLEIEFSIAIDRSP